MVCESLLDLFSSNLLPEDRPLTSMFDRPLEQYTGGKNQLSPKVRPNPNHVSWSSLRHKLNQNPNPQPNPSCSCCGATRSF